MEWLLLIIGLAHFALSFSPGISSWGIDYWSSIPIAWRVALLVALAAAAFEPLSRGAGLLADRLANRWWGGALCLAILGVLFVVFRSRVYVYGDGYSFAGYFTGGAFPKLSGQLSSQALDLAAHWAVYRGIAMPLGWPVESTYVILGPVAGILGVWAITRIARALGTTREARRLIVAAGLSSIAIVLWFGYVESYALVNAGILWSIAFAIEAQEKRQRIWAAWIMWIVAAAFHQLAVVLAPAIVWAHWRSLRRPWTGLSAAKRTAILGIGFIGWLVASVGYSWVKPDVFVPIFATTNSTYTAFSWAHLRDVFNLVLFLAPVALIGIIIWVRERGGPLDRKAGHGVLAVAAASLLYFAFWVDPLLGAFRDWDLLAGFGIPLSLWAGSLIANRKDYASGKPAIWLMMGVFAVVHAGCFVATLQDPQRSMLRVDALVREDVHYSGEFFSGKRLGPWALVLQLRFNRNDMAIEHLQKQISYDRSDAQVWSNLGGAWQLARRSDSAAVCFKEAVAREPKSLKFRYQLGMAQIGIEDYTGAHEQFRQGVALSDTAYDCRCMLAVACMRMQRPEEAGVVLDEAIQRSPNRFDAYYYRGAQREMLFDTAGAKQDYETSLAKGGRVAEVYLRLAQIYQWSNTPRKAIEITRLWEQAYPKSFEAPFMAGTTYLVLQQYDSAAAALARALVLRPNNALGMYYLATAYRNLNKPQYARELALAASKIDTALALPYLELVYLAADAGDRAAAKAAAVEYLRRSPQDSTMEYLRQFLEP
ncbi:MAG: hypothetical protein HZB43_10095 [candidate division Zixibacteria bacterium]|nr:hypothetical protein [candidate division Zixibacteria bacterium]